MTASRIEIANAFLARDDLSPTEEKIRDRCVAAQQNVNQVRVEYDQLVQQFNNIKQKAVEKELELLTADKHLEALIDLVVDLSGKPTDDSEGEN